MYTLIDISDLPSKGVYYKKGTYIKTRALSNYEIKKINSIKGNSFIDQLHKIEISLCSLDTNMDEFDICYTDSYYIYFITYGLTFKKINMLYDNREILFEINPKHFKHHNINFKNSDDLYYKELDLKFYVPSIYNMLQANKNVITEGLKDRTLVNNKIMLERMALVPFMQKNKISDGALEFVNEHMSQISDANIIKARIFVNNKIDSIEGQNITVNNVELLIQLKDLIDGKN